MAVLSGKARFLGLVLSAMGLFAPSTPLSAQEFNRGEALYDHHCKECHEGMAHKRPGSRIGSVVDLRSWVASWSVHSSLDWSNEEIDDVADYLNEKFYHLTDKP